MDKKEHKPVAITKSFYQLGTTSFPAYLSLGDDGMIIKGGTGATASFIVEQVKEMGIEPGPIYRIILDGLLDARLNGEVKTREDEVRFVIKSRSDSKEP